MPTGIANYQRSGPSRAVTTSAPSRTPTAPTGKVVVGEASPEGGRYAVRGQAGVPASGPQPPVREGWEVPDRPGGTLSARDLRAMQDQQRRVAGRRRRVSPLLVVAVLAFCLAAAGGAIFYTWSLRGQAATGAGEATTSESAATKPGPTYSFEPFIVNVAGTNGTRYLKASISVECADKKVSTEIGAVEYKVRDAILAVLSSYSLEDLSDVSKRDAIRRRVADAIEKALSGDGLKPPRVRGVYFLEFVIQ